MSQPQQMTIPQAIQLAIQHHQVNRFAEAENIYRQILSAQPDNTDALQLLGTLALQVNRADAALELFDRALKILPNAPQLHTNRGEALNRLSRFDEAILACEKAISLRPDFPEALNNLGIALRRSGRIAEAVAKFQLAIRHRPNLVQSYYNLASALTDLGRLDEAIDAMKQAVSHRPDYAEAQNNLGSLLHQAGRRSEAIDTFKAAIAMRPELPEAHFNLANVLRDEDRFEEAIAEFNAAIQLRPIFPEAYLNLGLLYQDQKKPDLAIAQYRKALLQRPDFGQARNNLGDRLRIVGRFDEALAELEHARRLLPNSVEVLSNLGGVLQDLGRLDEAGARYRSAIQISPDNATAHHNLSLALLLAGRFTEAWPEYEWRRRVQQLAHSQFNISRRVWDGSALHGKRILLHAEQGFGDTIHFCRYVQLVAERGGKVILACPPELSRLLSQLPGIVELITPGQPLPSFDEHCPLPSLPGKFATTLQTIPAIIPYLRADAELSQVWKSRLGEKLGSSVRRRVGLSWSGRSAHTNDHNRSIALEILRPIIEKNRDCEFVSLQKGMGIAEIARLSESLRPADFSDQIGDFADTAAIIGQLDLIITVDTSVAHLAGAMGKPVWVFIPMNPDWRWMLKRSDSPWYPTMVLFRQTQFQKWNDAVDAVAEKLQSLFPPGEG